MHPAFRAQYHESVLERVAPLYGIEPEALTFIGGFEAFVYGFERENRLYILKISHTLVYSEAYLEALLDWQAHLAADGVTLAAIVPSLAGRRLEAVLAPEGAFLAMVYERAPGERPQAGDRGPALYRSLGRLLGQLHASTTTYAAPASLLPGPEGTVLPHFRASAPAGHGWYFDALDALWARLVALPRTPEVFGLIHADLHTSNLHWDGDRLTAFDFDDAHASWFANDFAIVLFYVALGAGEHAAEAMQACIPALLAGYRDVAPFDPAWSQWVPDFLRLRRLVLYAALRHAFPGESAPPARGRAAAHAAGRHRARRPGGCRGLRGPGE